MDETESDLVGSTDDLGDVGDDIDEDALLRDDEEDFEHFDDNQMFEVDIVEVDGGQEFLESYDTTEEQETEAVESTEHMDNTEVGAADIGDADAAAAHEHEHEDQAAAADDDDNDHYEQRQLHDDDDEDDDVDDSSSRDRFQSERPTAPVKAKSSTSQPIPDTLELSHEDEAKISNFQKNPRRDGPRHKHRNTPRFRSRMQQQSGFVRMRSVTPAQHYMPLQMQGAPIYQQPLAVPLLPMNTAMSAHRPLLPSPMLTPTGPAVISPGQAYVRPLLELPRQQQPVVRQKILVNPHFKGPKRHEPLRAKPMEEIFGFPTSSQPDTGSVMQPQQDYTQSSGYQQIPASGSDSFHDVDLRTQQPTQQPQHQSQQQPLHQQQPSQYQQQQPQYLQPPQQHQQYQQQPLYQEQQQQYQPQQPLQQPYQPRIMQPQQYDVTGQPIQTSRPTLMSTPSSQYMNPRAPLQTLAARNAGPALVPQRPGQHSQRFRPHMQHSQPLQHRPVHASPPSLQQQQPGFERQVLNPGQRMHEPFRSVAPQQSQESTRQVIMPRQRAPQLRTLKPQQQQHPGVSGGQGQVRQQHPPPVRARHPQPRHQHGHPQVRHQHSAPQPRHQHGAHQLRHPHGAPPRNPAPQAPNAAGPVAVSSVDSEAERKKQERAKRFASCTEVVPKQSAIKRLSSSQPDFVSPPKMQRSGSEQSVVRSVLRGTESTSETATGQDVDLGGGGDDVYSEYERKLAEQHRMREAIRQRKERNRLQKAQALKQQQQQHSTQPDSTTTSPPTVSSTSDVTQQVPAQQPSKKQTLSAASILTTGTGGSVMSGAQQQTGPLRGGNTARGAGRGRGGVLQRGQGRGGRGAIQGGRGTIQRGRGAMQGGRGSAVQGGRGALRGAKSGPGSMQAANSGRGTGASNARGTGRPRVAGARGRGRGVLAASTGGVTAGAGQLTEDQRAHQFAIDKAEAAARQMVRESKDVLNAPQRSCKVMVTGIATSTNTDQIYDRARTCGAVKSFEMKAGSSEALIEFATNEQATMFRGKYDKRLLELSHLRVTLV